MRKKLDLSSGKIKNEELSPDDLLRREVLRDADEERRQNDEIRATQRRSDINALNVLARQDVALRIIARLLGVSDDQTAE